MSRVKKVKIDIDNIEEFSYPLIKEAMEGLLEGEFIEEEIIEEVKDILNIVKKEGIKEDKRILIPSILCLNTRNLIISKMSSKFGVPFTFIKNCVNKIENLLEKQGYYKDIEEMEDKEIEEKEFIEIKEEEEIQKKEEKPFKLLPLIFRIALIVTIGFILLYALNNFIIEFLKKLLFYTR